jgi:chromosome segregation ATPase
VGSADLSREIEELERELSGLRTRVDEDNSSFSALEQQIDQLRHRLTETRDAMRSREQELSDKKAALVEVQRLERLESYEQDLTRFREARSRVTKGADAYLKELDTYDGEVLGLRKLLEQMREAFGVDDERAAAVEKALHEEAQQLGGTWEAVVGATKWRLDELPAAAAADGDEPAKVEAEELPRDLQKRAEDSRASRSRILDYFKS